MVAEVALSLPNSRFVSITWEKKWISRKLLAFIKSDCGGFVASPKSNELLMKLWSALVNGSRILNDYKPKLKSIYGLIKHYVNMHNLGVLKTNNNVCYSSVNKNTMIWEEPERGDRRHRWNYSYGSDYSELFCEKQPPKLWWTAGTRVNFLITSGKENFQSALSLSLWEIPNWKTMSRTRKYIVLEVARKWGQEYHNYMTP